MAKRLFDLGLAIPLLLISLPLWFVAAGAIYAANPGPIFYCARRAGRGGIPFLMYKFRTMRVAAQQAGSAITAAADPRVFTVGKLLRVLKIDELPQLINVIRGDMSICGPRPEAVEIVEQYFRGWHWETLSVRPGLASPGSLFNYTHGDQFLQTADPQVAYVNQLLPIKLALEWVYVKQVSWKYDLQIIVRTGWTILCRAWGRRRFPLPTEWEAAQQCLQVNDVTINKAA